MPSTSRTSSLPFRNRAGTPELLQDRAAFMLHLITTSWTSGPEVAAPEDRDNVNPLPARDSAAKERQGKTATTSDDSFCQNPCGCGGVVPGNPLLPRSSVLGGIFCWVLTKGNENCPFSFITCV